MSHAGICRRRPASSIIGAFALVLFGIIGQMHTGVGPTVFLIPITNAQSICPRYWINSKAKNFPTCLDILGISRYAHLECLGINKPTSCKAPSTCSS